MVFSWAKIGLYLERDLRITAYRIDSEDITSLGLNKPWVILERSKTEKFIYIHSCEMAGCHELKVNHSNCSTKE